MTKKTHAEQLGEKLRNLRERKAVLRAELQAIDGQEERLVLALKVLEEELGPEAVSGEDIGGGELPDARRAQAGNTVEGMISKYVFQKRDGVASREVAELMVKHAGAKYGTVMVALSRMVKKGLLRREDDRLYVTQKWRKP